MSLISGTLGNIEFNYACEDEFTKEIRANIAGIRPEDVGFAQLDPFPEDNIVKLQITCDTRLSQTEYVHYYGIMEIDTREFYGFDYYVENGLLYIKLYKEKKKDIQMLGFGYAFKTKYPKEPMLWV